MGFTTEWGGPAGGKKGPPALTLRFIGANGDILTVHRHGPPLPWNALANGRTTRFENMLGRQRARIGSGVPVFVSITPLNVFRNGIGGGWPDDLGPACISNPLLQMAFRNYARVVVERMHPDYLSLGVEMKIYM